jgi:hypothetical protein
VVDSALLENFQGSKVNIRITSQDIANFWQLAVSGPRGSTARRCKVSVEQTFRKKWPCRGFRASRGQHPFPDQHQNAKKLKNETKINL